MPPRAFYAVRFVPGSLFGARLHRFQGASVRALRMERDAAAWRGVPASAARRLAARADARKAWTYEGPGAWSTRVGPLRSAWWRLRL